MFRKYISFFLFIAALYSTQPTLAHAQILLTITPSQLSKMPGHTITFMGTLSNTSNAEVFINGDSYHLSGGGLRLDDTKFSDNAPLTLAGGETTSPFSLFDVDIDPSTLPGQYTGTFTIKGGEDNSAQNILDAENFTVSVIPTASVPEPGLLAISAAFLVIVGLWLLSARMFRKHPRHATIDDSK